MRNFSRERIDRLSREILTAMQRTKSVTLMKDPESVLGAISAALFDQFRREEEREENARKRIAALPKAPARGSREYADLFDRLMEEEYVREGLDS